MSQFSGFQVNLWIEGTCFHNQGTIKVHVFTRYMGFTICIQYYAISYCVIYITSSTTCKLVYTYYRNEEFWKKKAKTNIDI